VCPVTGLARLSYGQARALLDEHTAVRGPGTGWDPHESAWAFTPGPAGSAAR
jgi:hypothetical protein